MIKQKAVVVWNFRNCDLAQITWSIVTEEGSLKISLVLSVNEP